MRGSPRSRRGSRLRLRRAARRSPRSAHSPCRACRNDRSGVCIRSTPWRAGNVPPLDNVVKPYDNDGQPVCGRRRPELDRGEPPHRGGVARATQPAARTAQVGAGSAIQPVSSARASAHAGACAPAAAHCTRRCDRREPCTNLSRRLRRDSMRAVKVGVSVRRVSRCERCLTLRECPPRAAAEMGSQCAVPAFR